LRPRHAAFAAVALAAAASAEPWAKVDEMPGGIAVEIDQASKAEEMDGVRLVERASFRKQLPTGMMETAVAIDCAQEEVKIRGIRITAEGKVLAEKADNQARFGPINPGSAEAIYFKALCGKEVAGAAAIPPSSPADEGADAPPEDATTTPPGSDPGE
jgi:hypothetical protein